MTTTPTIEDRIIAAYAELAAHPGGYVMLSRLHEHMPISRTLMDDALKSLFRDDRISLIAEVNQRALTAADRTAAVHVGGDVKHLYKVR